MANGWSFDRSILCRARPGGALTGVSWTSLCMRYDVWACFSCEPRAAGNGWTTVAVLSGPGPAGAAFACRFTPSSGVWEGGSAEWLLRVAAGCCDVPVSVALDLRPAPFALRHSRYVMRAHFLADAIGGVVQSGPSADMGWTPRRLDGAGRSRRHCGYWGERNPGGRSATIFAAIAQCADRRGGWTTWQMRSTRAKRMRVRRAVPSLIRRS